MVTKLMNKILEFGCFTEYIKGNKSCENCEFRKSCRMLTKQNAEKDFDLMDKKEFLKAVDVISKEGCKGISCIECSLDAGSDLCKHLVTLSHQDGDY